MTCSRTRSDKSFVDRRPLSRLDRLARRQLRVKRQLRAGDTCESINESGWHTSCTPGSSSSPPLLRTEATPPQDAGTPMTSVARQSRSSATYPRQHKTPGASSPHAVTGRFRSVRKYRASKAMRRQHRRVDVRSRSNCRLARSSRLNINGPIPPPQQGLRRIVSISTCIRLVDCRCGL